MNNNVYIKQKERALKRKIEIINIKGGKCSICGYDKNISALDFHHLDPLKKSFQLDSRHLSNTNIEVIKEEVEKCILVCANCHRELHHKELDKENIGNLLSTFETKNISINKISKESVCKRCGKTFPYSLGKVFCSKECREDKGYPSLEDIETTYKTLGSWEKVAKHYNLTRKIINTIRKRARSSVG